MDNIMNRQMSIPEYILVLTLGLSVQKCYIVHIYFLTRPKKMYEKLRAANFDIARPRSWWAASLPAANFDIALCSKPCITKGLWR